MAEPVPQSPVVIVPPGAVVNAVIQRLPPSASSQSTEMSTSIVHVWATRRRFPESVKKPGSAVVKSISVHVSAMHEQSPSAVMYE